jgi:hypothetical protein
VKINIRSVSTPTGIESSFPYGTVTKKAAWKIIKSTEAIMMIFFIFWLSMFNKSNSEKEIYSKEVYAKA